MTKLLSLFFSDNPGMEELRREEKKLETDRISKNYLLRGTAFYKGKVVAEEEKTGFTNKEKRASSVSTMFHHRLTRTRITITTSWSGCSMAMVI